MLIPLSQIDPPAENARTTPASVEETAQLEASVRAQGVVTPILLRPDGNRYQIIAGSRRFAAALAVGLTEIPAHVDAGFAGGHILAAQVAENTVRSAMAPVDTWRAMVALQQQGYELAHCAAALGLTDRRARQLDRLGRLHPDVLALIETHGLPAANALRLIANASPAAQKKALKAPRAVVKVDGTIHVNWPTVAHACAARRISRSLAIFPLADVRVTFEEDLFAEPDSHEQFTTTDVDGFLRAQQAALEARVAEAKAAKRRVELGEAKSTYPYIALPKGWQISHGNPDKPRREETVFMAVNTAPDSADLGAIISHTAINPKLEKAREKEREKAKAARATATAQAQPAAEDAGQGASPPAPEPDDAPTPEAPEPTPAAAGERNQVTRAGLAIIAEAKTQALRARLRDTSQPIDLEDLVVLLVLTLHAPNVSVRGYERPDGGHQGYDFHGGGDLVRQLINPDGTANTEALTPAAVAAIASETLARCLAIDPPDSDRSQYIARSGAVAEWIGHALAAEQELPRFDTEAFLSTVTAAELKRAAAEAQIKPNRKAAELRALLQGNAPNYRPDASQFGAPGPKPGRG